MRWCRYVTMRVTSGTRPGAAPRCGPGRRRGPRDPTRAPAHRRTPRTRPPRSPRPRRVDPGDLDEDVVGDAGALQLGHRAQHVEVGAVVRVAARTSPGRAGARRPAAGDEVGGEPRARDELVGGVLRLGPAAEDALDVARRLQQRPDGGEGEAAVLELADPLEAHEVVGAVELVAALAPGRRQQALALVVADGVDGQPGPVGQVVDAPLAGRRSLGRGRRDRRRFTHGRAPVTPWCTDTGSDVTSVTTLAVSTLRVITYNELCTGAQAPEHVLTI